MIKKDLIKIFIDEIYSKPPMTNYSTNKVKYNHIDEIWSIDLADMIDYKISNNKKYRYIFINIDSVSKYLRVKPLKNKNSKTSTEESSKILIESKRTPIKLEFGRRSEWYNSIFQNFINVKKYTSLFSFY